MLASAVAFLRSVPSRVRAKRWEDLALGLRAHAALLADPTTATSSLRVGSVGNHVVVLEGQSGRPAELARSAIGRLSGVIDVRLEPANPRCRARRPERPSAMMSPCPGEVRGT